VRIKHALQSAKTPSHSTNQERKKEKKTEQKNHSRSIPLHHDRHRLATEAIRLRHHALAEAVRDVVRAQERDGDYRWKRASVCVEGDERGRKEQEKKNWQMRKSLRKAQRRTEKIGATRCKGREEMTATA
jgi:hypothetical protein